MPELMAWADVAVAAGGSTNWELSFMGLPSIILVLADNQRAIAEKLGSMKITINLGCYEDVSPTEIALALKPLLDAPQARMEMSQQGQKLVDGGGNTRIAAILAEAS